MADTRFITGLATAPRSVEQITNNAQDYEYDAGIPLRYWLRTASALLKQAEVYSREHDDEATYLLLFRHSHLILAHLAQHPEARDRLIKPQMKDAQQEVSKNLKTLDDLKPRLKERYERYVTLQRERDQRRSLQFGGTAEAAVENRDERGLQPNVQRLEARENRDLAVKLAQRELSRRAAAQQPSGGEVGPQNDDISQRLRALRPWVSPEQRNSQQDSRASQQRGTHQTATYRYPSMPSRPQADVHAPLTATVARPPHQERNSSYDVPPPALPPKPHHNQQPASRHYDTDQSLPPRPEKIVDRAPSKSAPVPAEPTYTFAPSAYLENGTPLRTIFLPQTLRTTFLRIAYKNTMANLETCAFLAGSLIANAFFVSKLVVPAQTATSDTCEMTDESDLFDYVDSQNLMILGWIHTHPSQTCFMSSRDLHTHSGYQMMLAESVAIVCAPSKGDTTHGGDWGAYRLTDPPGKKAILACDKPGVFHPHEVDNIYTDAMRPGHVVEAKDMEFEVVDLRKK